MRPILLFLALAFALTGRSQNDEDYVNDNVLKYDDHVYKPNIKTVLIHESNWDYAAPIIDLAGGNQIELSFDDLDADRKQYSVAFIHCNSDWTPSDLMISEYMDGFFDVNIINFTFSANTIQKYTFYTILFPQSNVKFSKSGNYIAYVYLNGDKKDLVLSRRFMVYDSKASISTTFRQPMGNGEDDYERQHLDFTITAPGYDVTNPNTDLKVTLMQNNRWDNAVQNIKPTFLGGGQYTYSLDDASTFRGGNEFRYFDIRSNRFITERVKDIKREADLNTRFILINEESRATKAYVFYNDLNGGFMIRNRETQGNQDTESDYAYVNFFMPYSNPESAGNFYVLGKLSDWRMNKKSMMTYNYKRMGYELEMFLKQGFYNYMIVLKTDADKDANESVIEGSHWDTENDYYILVYHRKLGTYYDQLIGYKKVNSLRK